MQTNPFENSELCDGRMCVIRSGCVRYMGNVDLSSPQVNPYVVFRTDICPTVCPYFKSDEDERYPQAHTSL